jgi:hypothetical protein
MEHVFMEKLKEGEMKIFGKILIILIKQDIL